MARTVRALDRRGSESMSVARGLQRCCSSLAFQVIRKTVRIGRRCRPEIGQ